MLFKNFPLMSLSRSFALAVPLCAAGAMVSSCASRTPEAYVALPANADPSTEIESTEGAMLEARQANIHILAPETFSSAQKSLEAARESRSDNDSNEDVLKHVAFARAWLTEAQNKSKLANAAMAQVLDARAGALTAEAPRLMSKEFAELDREATKLSAKIESDGNMKPAQEDSEKLVKRYAQIERDSLVKNLLGASLESLEQAKDEGAKKHAPKTLETAEAQMKAAREAIHISGARNVTGYQSAVAAAVQSAAQTLEVTRQAKVLGKTPNEELVLREQRDREAAASMANLNLETSKLLSQTNASRTRLQADLKSSKARSEKLSAIRERFSSSEAVVSDRGDAVVITLKGLQFPSNRSEIPSTAFPLLSKVQEALAEFPEAGLTIEGHTDSVGSRDINQKLSQARADAVSNYLVSNNAADSTRIEAVGKGLEEPIASNKSAQGRAQNRRIDVIVDMKATASSGTPAPKSDSSF